MKKYSYFVALLLLFSCNNDDNKDIYPTVILKSITLQNPDDLQLKINFHKSAILPEGHYYNPEEFTFLTNLASKDTPPTVNKELERFWIGHFSKLGYTGETFELTYLENRFKSVIISCKQKFNNQEPGINLNNYFKVTGEFVYRKDGKYAVTNGEDNLFEMNTVKIDDLIFPGGIHICLKDYPDTEGKYNFSIQFTDVNDREIKFNLPAILLKGKG